MTPRHQLSAASLLACQLACPLVRAQDARRIEDDKAKDAAKALAAAVAKLDLPVKTSLDGKTGTGLHAEKATPLGGDASSTWEGLIAGRSGISHLEQDWAAELPKSRPMTIGKKIGMVSRIIESSSMTAPSTT